MKFLKITAITVMILVAVIVSAMIVAVMVVKPNDYKDEISVAVKNATGRDLAIKGDIGLSVFPWIGLELGEVSVSNAKGFSDAAFAEVKAAQVRVALLPLLRMKVEIGKLKLEGLRLNLARQKNGKNNWDDLAQGSAPAQKKAATPKEISKAESAEESSAELPEIVIGGVEVADAQIQWKDAQAGTQSSIEKFNLNTSEINLHDPISFSVDCLVKNKKPEVSAEIDVSGEIAFNLDEERYGINDLEVSIDASGDTVPNGKQTITLNTSLNADMKKQTAEINPLIFQIGDLKVSSQLSATDISGKAKAKGSLSIAAFSPKALMQSLGMEAPATTDKTVLEKVQLDLAFNGSTQSAALSDITLKLDDTSITGNASVKHLTGNPAMQVKLAIDVIDADRYLPPALDNAAPVSESNAPAATGDEVIELPLDLLRSLDARGELSIGQFKVMNMVLTQFVAGLKAKNGLINLKPMDVDLYKGTFRGHASMDARKAIPRYAMQITLKDVDASPMMADFMQSKPFVSGGLNMSANISTNGDRVNRLKQQLNGDVKFAFKEGELQGINIPERIREASALLNKKPYTAKDDSNSTRFSTMGGSATIKNGVMTQPDMTMGVPPYVNVAGNGTINLVQEDLRYHLNVSYTEDGDASKPKTLPIVIKGSFDSPKVTLDWKALRKKAIEKKKQEVKEKAKEKAVDKLKDKLKKKFKFKF